MSTAPQDSKDRLFVNSVEKAFKVIEAFGRDRRDLSLNQICERTALNKSAAQRFTHTLLTLGYLEQDESSRRYTLSARTLISANSFLCVDPLVARSTPHIVEIRRQLSVRIGVGHLYGTEIMYLIPLQSNREAFLTAHPGQRVPIYCTSSGRALLAQETPAEAERIIESCERKPYTRATLTDTDDIVAELDKVRSAGYAVTDGEFLPDDINAAAPIFDGNGKAIAAVTAACSRNEWTVGAVKNEVVPRLLETARAISING